MENDKISQVLSNVGKGIVYIYFLIGLIAFIPLIPDILNLILDSIHHIKITTWNEVPKAIFETSKILIENSPPYQVAILGVLFAFTGLLFTISKNSLTEEEQKLFNEFGKKLLKISLQSFLIFILVFVFNALNLKEHFYALFLNYGNAVQGKLTLKTFIFIYVFCLLIASVLCFIALIRTILLLMKKLFVPNYEKIESISLRFVVVVGYVVIPVSAIIIVPIKMLYKISLPVLLKIDNLTNPFFEILGEILGSSNESFKETVDRANQETIK